MSKVVQRRTSGAFHADIVDEVFLAEVAKRRELFGTGDALRVDLGIRTTKTPDEYEFERRILKVHEHIKADRSGGQMSLV